jgi:PAT family beta-lactamase induction signal transducer AmpG
MTTEQNSSIQSWNDTFQSLLNPRVLTMLFLGFSAGIPLLLIFSSLSLWLIEAGIERKTVTFFSWAALGFSFKFIWAPLIDKLPVPILTKLMGRRRSWLLVAQLLIILAISMMGSVDPGSSESALTFMAMAAVLLGFSAATQDIVIDAFRIESAEPRYQGMMSASYIAGYRIGMVVSGAGALYLASWLGSEKTHYVYAAWQQTYFAMAAVMLIGVCTTLLITEPECRQRKEHVYKTTDYLRLVFVFICSVMVFAASFFYTSSIFNDLNELLGKDAILGFFVELFHFALSVLVAIFTGKILVQTGVVKKEMANETWIEPITDFFMRYGVNTALLILLLIGLYRISDIVPGVISNIFYQDLGFSKPEIATAVKTFGVIVSIAGGFMGGLVATRYGVFRTLMIGAVLTAFTNLVFVWLALVGHDIYVMYTAVTIDNLAAGFASAAFVAFLSSLTSVSFTAVQYAIFSSLMTLLPKTIGGYSGTIVDNIGYPWFFIFTTLIGIPVLWLVWKVTKNLKNNQ